MRGRASGAPKARVWKLIDAKCRDCVYDSEEPGTWVEQIEACQISDCPLWEIRKVSVKAAPRGRAA